MSGWDYVAMVAVWYLLAARVAIGGDFHLNAKTRSLWPAFVFYLLSRNWHHAGYRQQLFRTVTTLFFLAVVVVVAYVVAAYLSSNVLIRFLLAFPLASLATVVLVGGGALVYGLFDNSPFPARSRSSSRRDDPVLKVRDAFEEIRTRGEIPGLTLIDTEMRKLLSNQKLVTQAIVNGREPSAVVYIFITHTVVDELRSGRHHIYRGVLSYTGVQLQSAFAAATQRLVTCGVYDEEERDEEIASLRQDIQDVG